MKILLDMCVASRTLIQTLTDLGHDVTTAYDIGVSSLDEDLLAAAVIRFVGMSAAQWNSAMTRILATHPTELASGALFTVSRGRIRIRR